MARPRKVSDEDVFAAVLRLMNRSGPAQWTLADVAGEVGVTASALVQRFGSKRALQVALMKEWSASAPELFDRLRAEASSPLASIYAYADVVARLGESPEGLAHHLAYLQLDLTDPELHARLRRQAQDTRRLLAGLVGDAQACGEIANDVAADALARAIEVTLNGSLLTWAVHQEGEAAASLRHDLETLLELHAPV